MIRKFLSLLVFVASVVPFAAAQSQIAKIDNEELSGTVSRLYDEVVMGGYLPLQVRLQNKTDRPQKWGLVASSSIDENRGSVLDFSRQFEVPAKAMETFVVLVPTPSLVDFEAVRNQGYYYGYSSVTVRGRLVGPNEERTFNCYSSGKTDFDSLLSSLSGRNGVDIVGYGKQVKPFLPERYFEESKGYVPPHERYEIQLVELQPTTMVADWRGYWGFGLIVLSTNELVSLNPLQLQALMNWVRAGGVLTLPDWSWSSRKGIQELERDDFERGVCFYGLGRVQVGPIAGGYSFVANEVGKEGSFPLNKQSVSGVLGYAFEEFASAGGYYVVLMCFIVLVGPVNLMVFCRGRRRYRIFLTTPLIVVACLTLIGLYSLLRDGVGGEGERFRMSVFGGEANQALRIQSQGSQVGMIFDRSFEVPGKAHVERFFIPGGSRKRFEVEEGARGGDWFVSRSKNSHLIAWTESSREQIRLESSGAGGAVVVSSRVKGTLEPFVFKDKDERYWYAESLSLGETKTLVPIDAQEVKGHRTQLAAGKAAKLYAKMMERQLRGKQVFFGELKNGPTPAWDTLGSVAWEDGGHLALGRVVVSGKEGK
ncbi:hypothetical protein [Pelagicoccus sp. SDUM812005]|uniref:hypothetical protein n=1 Tax=Pelagicoccus sp. SDUM812005 TaxID=3041257 RepID=UPI00280EA0A5|nr:hypothetical protein [Pelagicoccus sp. SDUM812005]MDQ8182635.1 hypothetical protein [Pelagicoccus sp. SDUM812005]